MGTVHGIFLKGDACTPPSVREGSASQAHRMEREVAATTKSQSQGQQARTADAT
eukprot:CAMPEP_0197883150 /NCGR_PEP_ID=MMETSP1439-20131203/10075_1 /TAXON_ID=66791 /ORGANISM="Gonyaulax spinifera, Strain CCMP409" /LENGTH=53 /DNA_ID=CAMNT_0043502857 /DNA_START=156 /DNA_END=317 /DNA_ORIENTATION=+